MIKVATDYRSFGKEIGTMKKIFRKANFDPICSTPDVIDYGMLIQQKSQEENEKNERDSDLVLMSYVIMPRFGINLDKFFEESSQYRLTNSSILHLGLEIIELLEGQVLRRR